MDRKSILLIIMTVFCIFCLWRGCSNENYKKERKSLTQDIKRLQNKYDSLQAISNSLIQENLKYQSAYKADSVKIDSLKLVYNSQLNQTIKMEHKANDYLKKYNSLTKGIDKLQNNQHYKSGDSLIISLGNKIN